MNFKLDSSFAIRRPKHRLMTAPYFAVDLEKKFPERASLLFGILLWLALLLWKKWKGSHHEMGGSGTTFMFPVGAKGGIKGCIG